MSNPETFPFGNIVNHNISREDKKEIKRKGDFNRFHPEKGIEEVFVTNIKEGEEDSVRWETKRVGDIAYDSYGKKIENAHPVFVQALELLKNKINPYTFNDLESARD